MKTWNLLIEKKDGSTLEYSAEAEELHMNEECVIVNLGEGIECRVRVDCPPNTPNDILQRLALTAIQNALLQKKRNPMVMYADAMQRIDDYDYLQGRGHRWEAEQNLKKIIGVY